MAATTLPLPYSKNRINGAIPDFDEFGAQSIPPVTSGNNWDEEIVPALRKRLEGESKLLNQRLNYFDEHPVTGSRLQESQSARPIARADRSQVLQDGLGSDNLIPSEWATGSSAQFTAIAPRSRAYGEERSRTISSSQQYKPVVTYSPPISTSRPIGLAPHSPSTLSQTSNTSQSPVNHESPSPLNMYSTQSVSQAREKARRVAREREMQAHAQHVSSGMRDEDYSAGNDWLRESQQLEDEQENQRIRTISSPAVQKFDGPAKKSSPPVARDNEPPLKKSTSGANLGRGLSLRDYDDNQGVVTPSASMSKIRDRNVALSEMRKTKSSARLRSGEGNMSAGTHTKSVSKADSVTKNSPRRNPDMKISISQSTLDAFGPLGGLKQRRGPGWMYEEGEEQVGDLSNSQSISNPWDEELLPTIKKKLAQQKMLEGLSRDEDLVDTWDRNGLPLSKRQVSLKQRRSESKSGNEDNAQLLLSDNSKRVRDEEKDLLSDEGLERMKRLQGQLDLDYAPDLSKPHIKSSPDQSFDSQEQKRNQLEEDQQQQQQRSEQEHQKQQRQLKRREKQQRQMDLEQQQQYQMEMRETGQDLKPPPIPNDKASSLIMQAAKREQEVVLAEVDAGCCKCTIM